MTNAEKAELQRLLARCAELLGTFTCYETDEQAQAARAVRSYMFAAEPAIEQFIAENCSLNPNYTIACSALQELFAEWWSANCSQRKRPTKQMLGKVVKRLTRSTGASYEDPFGTGEPAFHYVGIAALP